MERRTFSKLGAGLVVGFVAATIFVLIAAVIIVLLILALTGQNSIVFLENVDQLLNMPVANLILVAVSDSIILLVVWLFARRLPKAPARHASLSAGASWNLLFSVLCVGMVLADLLSLVGFYVNDIFAGLFPMNQSAIPDILQLAENLPALAADFVLACVIAPVFEELIFRKIIAERLRPFGDMTALLVSGIAFGLFHQNFMQMFYAAALGLLFGYVYFRTGKLWMAILLHSLFNLLGGILPSVLHIWCGAWAAPIASIITLVFWGLGVWRFIALRRSFMLDSAPFRFSTPIRGRVIVGNAGAILFIIMCVGFSLYTVWLPVITGLLS